jgi:DNA recombination-dependent growth factor C
MLKKDTKYKFITWKIPVDYTEEELNKISDEEILLAQKEVEEGRVLPSKVVLDWIDSLKTE